MESSPNMVDGGECGSAGAHRQCYPKGTIVLRNEKPNYLHRAQYVRDGLLDHDVDHRLLVFYCIQRMTWRIAGSITGHNRQGFNQEVKRGLPRLRALIRRRQ